MRIAEFRAGTVTSFGREKTENVLNAVTRIGKQLTGPAARRTAVVCIGAADVCDIEEPRDQSYSLLWPAWADSMSAAAAAHLSVSVIDPSGLAGRTHVNAAGLVSFTGGEVFANVNDVAPAIDRIWAEAGDYYLLGYTPTARSRQLHVIDVSTTRHGVHVRARRRRGD